jgi:hypothetical protein
MPDNARLLAPGTLLLQDTDVLELQQHASYRKALKAELAAQQAEQDALDAALLEEQRQAAQQRQAAAVAALEAAPVIFSAEQLAGAQELPAVPAALDWTQLDTSVPENALLVQVLQGFKHDVLEGLSGVTNAVQVRVFLVVWGLKECGRGRVRLCNMLQVR